MEAQQVPAGWGDGNAHLVWLVLMSKVKARRVGSHPLAIAHRGSIPATD